MPTSWDKMDRAQMPTAETVSAYVGNPLWNDLCRHVEQEYQSKPVFEYSGCSIPGWNVKYRKAGRSLCTLYPMEGSFLAMVVIGAREKLEFDLALPALSADTQRLFEANKDKNGLCWLMFEVKEETVLADVKGCIAMRRGERVKRS